MFTLRRELGKLKPCCYAVRLTHRSAGASPSDDESSSSIEERTVIVSPDKKAVPVAESQLKTQFDR
jgi:hypothetical protein